MANIVIIEDDEDIRELVLYTLKANHLDGFGYESGRAFFDEHDSNVDLFLLDVMLPEEDGIQILLRIRESLYWKDVPVIMLTAKDTEMDKVKALDFGADDYITKPFGVLELLSRIHARLRRVDNKANEDFIYEDLKLNLKKREVSVLNEKIDLTLKEFELLYMLMLNQGIVIERDQMFEKIWGYDFQGESRTLDIHMNTLRKKLGSASTYIQTIRGVGYKIGD